MVRLLSRLALGLGTGVLLAVLVPAGLGGGSVASPSCARAAGLNHAAIVVQHQAGATIVRCAEFTSADIGAEEALSRAKVQYGTSDAYGGPGYRALCQVDREPAAYPQDCLNSGTYWSLWIRSGGGWTLAPVGLSAIHLHDGDWFGVRYLEFHHESPPPLPGAACAATPTPPPTPPATAAPQPTSAGGGDPNDPAPHPPTPLPAATPAATPAASAVTTSEPPPPSPTPSPRDTGPVQSAGAAPRGGVDLGLLVAAAGGGALLGLLVIQLIARRRR